MILLWSLNERQEKGNAFSYSFLKKRGQTSQIIWPGICQFSLFVEFRTFCYQTELWTFIWSSNEQKFSSLMLFKYFCNEFCVSLNFWSAWFDLIKYDFEKKTFFLRFYLTKIIFSIKKAFFNRKYNFLGLKNHGKMIYFGHVKILSGRRSKNLSGDVRLYWGWSIFSGDGKSFLGKINRG